MYKIYITSEKINELIDFGNSNLTEEVVALLTGKYIDYYSANVSEIHKVKNCYNGNKFYGYVPDPNAFFQILSKTSFIDKSSNIDFIGVFHTHPLNLPIASQTDLLNAGYYGFYIIYSPKYNSIKTYFNIEPNSGIFKKAKLIVRS